MNVIKCKAVISYEALFKVPIPDNMESYEGLDDVLMRAEEEALSTLPDEIGDEILTWHINWDTVRFFEDKERGS